MNGILPEPVASDGLLSAGAGPDDATSGDAAAATPPDPPPTPQERAAAMARRVEPLLGWLTRQRTQVDLELACAEHAKPERGIEKHTVARLPGCIAELPDHIFLELLNCGAAHVYPRIDGCAHAEISRARVDALARIVDLLGHEGRLRAMVAAPKGRKRPVMDATHVPVSRRQVLLLSGSVAKRDMPATYRSAQERFVDAVRILSPEAPEAAAQHPAAGIVLSAPACIACGLCVRVCPEDALKLHDLGDAPEDAGLPTDDAVGARRPGPRARRVMRLAQRPDRCDGCRACLDACPVLTLTATGPWALSTLWLEGAAPVVDVLTRRCERCGTRVPVSPGPQDPRTELLCQQCAFRRDNPFGSALPAQALEKLPPDVLAKLGYAPPAGAQPPGATRTGGQVQPPGSS